MFGDSTKEVESVQKNLICSHVSFISLDIPATIGLSNTGNNDANPLPL